VESGLNVQRGFQSHWRLFVNVAKAFCIAYLLLYVVVPFCRGAVPPEAWGIHHLAAIRAKAGAIYNYSFGIVWVKEAMTAVFPVALLILSMWYGGILTEFYSTVTQFGIFDVRGDRRGQDAARTPVWMDRIRRSKEVTIVGTVSKGWFVKAFHELDEFLEQPKSKLKHLRVYLLDPFGETWRSRIQNGFETYRNFWNDVWQVATSLEKLLAHSAVELHFYDSEPISCVVAKGMIYLGLYLPRTDRREVPEFTISVGSFLGEKIYNESIMKLASSGPRIDAQALSQYMTVLREHADSTGESFWNDPRIHCDFCKESAGLAQAFSRRFPEFGSRIAFEGLHARVLPTIGQLTNEHSLLVSKRHVTSSAQLGEPELKEVMHISEIWRKKLKSLGKTALMFEHGVPFESASYGGCGICHSHIHLLSVAEDTQDFAMALTEFLHARNYRPKRQQIERWEAITQFRNHPYIAIRVGAENPEVFVFPPNEPVESQLMRQFAAKQSGRNKVEWDWRAPKDSEQIEKEAKRLKLSLDNVRNIFI
jgi:diadenosine tetraphosphate (Ap4A) HIT family hydrolase